jgi:hypothetical protein
VEETHGFIIKNNETNKTISYLPDLHGLPDDSLELVKKTNTVICDATYLESDLTDDKTHFNNKELNYFLKNTLQHPNTILANIGSFAGYTHEDLSKRYPEYSISFDGMIIDLS